VTVEVLGAAEFARTMHQFADDVRNLTAAHTAAGGEVLRLVHGRARRRSGALAASFAAAVADDGVTVSSPLVYAGVQEFGWARHRITPSRALTSSLDDAAPAVETIYTRAVEAALGKVRGR